MAETSDHLESSPEAISLQEEHRQRGCSGCVGTLILSVFFAIFTVAGLLVIWLAALFPLSQSINALSWVSVPCRIISSEVIGKETYRIQIHYAYIYDGQPFQGDRYSFFNMKTSGKADKERVVKRYPPGAQSVCFVDPDHPAESVIHRGLDWNLLWGLLGVPFLLVGLGGMYAMRLKKEKSSPADGIHSRTTLENSTTLLSTTASPQATTTEWGFEDADLQEKPGPITLKSESSPAGAFFVVLTVALIWNGIVLAFCSFRAQDWMQGRWQLFPELVLLPFALIGVLLTVGVVHSFLGLFNPVPVLTLSRRMIPLGGSATLTWTFSGASHSIRQVRVSLKGLEEARYTQGTETRTDLAVFFDEVLFESTDPGSISHGEMQLQVPTDSMHSLESPHNKIKWQVQFRGTIPFWPDVNSEFSIRVIPHE